MMKTRTTAIAAAVLLATAVGIFAASQFTYTKAVKPSRLHNEISTNAGLSVSLDRIEVNGLVIDVYMSSNLPANEVSALGLIVSVCGAAWFIYDSGHQAAHRVLSMLDQPGKAWLDVHEIRAEQVERLFILTAVLALFAGFAEWKKPKFAKALGILTLLASFGIVVASGWISYAGGRIRHPEFRDGPPPMEASHDDAHSHEH